MRAEGTTSNQIEASVEIERSREDVYSFYQDFRNLPRFLGDVMQIEITGPNTSRWTIEGPFGIKGHWDMEVVEAVPNERIVYQIAGSTIANAKWTLTFETTSNPASSRVREILQAPMGHIELALMALIGKHPEAEVHANLQRLKQLLETGSVSETSYAVRGKFNAAQ